MATVEHEPEPPCDTDDFLGVDLGVENLATDSDGEMHSGEDVEEVRVKNQTLKQALQSAADLAANHRRRKWPAARRTASSLGRACRSSRIARPRQTACRAGRCAHGPRSCRASVAGIAVTVPAISLLS